MKRKCVLGVLKTEEGLRIKEEMQLWLREKYELICVEQDPPGALIEFPAMMQAAQLSLATNEPVLYLHTKGAANIHGNQKFVRQLWMHEFNTCADWYFDQINCDEPTVAAPIVSKNKRITWFNGFVLNPAAARQMVKHLHIPDDRMWYEQGFLNECYVNVVGRYSTDSDEAGIAWKNFCGVSHALFNPLSHTSDIRKHIPELKLTQEFLAQHHCTVETQYEKAGSPILCVFGCLLTDSGKKIKEEMLPWLTEKYSVTVVNQEAPGSLFEFPALKYAKELSIKTNKPVLYIHTKGAGNSKNLYDQSRCRAIWKNEFYDNYDWYANQIKAGYAAVCCPFTHKNLGMTILNGFMATPEAWKKANVYLPNEGVADERLGYEHLFDFTDCNVYGHIMNDVILGTTAFDRMLTYINNYKV